MSLGPSCGHLWTSIQPCPATAWLPSPSDASGRAGSKVWAPHCYSWHEIILLASSEAHKNAHILCFIRAAQSHVAPS